MDDPEDPVDDVEKHTEPGPNVEAMNVWDEVIDDLEATAAQYESEGWDTLQLHPGDVAILTGEATDRRGIDVLLPDDEFDELTDLMESGVAFDDYKVFRAEHSGLLYLVVVMEDEDAETAVLYPAYYDLQDPDTNDMLDRARLEGEVTTYLRILTGDFVEFNHDDPDLFAPASPQSEADPE